jgi:hypothetical protein
MKNPCKLECIVHHSRGDDKMEILATVPMFAAAGYSMAYLLGGGGVVGALVIFMVAKAAGK